MSLARKRSFLRINRFDADTIRKIEQFENNVRSKFDQIDQDTGAPFALPDGSDGEVLLIRDSEALFGYAPFQIITTVATITAPPNCIVRVGTTTGNISVLLPAAPRNGEWVKVVATNAIAFNVTVDGNGHSINNGFEVVAATTPLKSDGESVLYVYVAADSQWRIASKYIPKITPLISPLTVDANTVALWRLDPPATGGDGKIDSGPNGLTLALAGGTERYGELSRGQQGLLCDGATYFKRAGGVNDAALNIVGDITIECLARPFVNTTQVILEYGAAGATANQNVLYEVFLTDATPTGPAAAGVATQGLYYETGVKVGHTVNDTCLFPLNEVQHLAWVRSGTTALAYVDGFLHSSTALTAGTLGGAPAQTLYIGANHAGGQLFTGIIGSVKISNVARSAAEIFKSFARTLGVAGRSEL